MGVALKAIETAATIDDAQHLRLDEALPLTNQKRVRVIVLMGDDTHEDTDIDELTWQRAITTNAAFDFLKDTAEDIYKWEDGEAVTHEA